MSYAKGSPAAASRMRLASCLFRSSRVSVGLASIQACAIVRVSNSVRRGRRDRCCCFCTCCAWLLLAELSSADGEGRAFCFCAKDVAAATAAAAALAAAEAAAIAAACAAGSGRERGVSDATAPPSVSYCVFVTQRQPF